MKTIKLLDFWGQVLLISGSLLSLAWSTSLVFYGYFFVGGWQVLSFLLHHFFVGTYFAARGRRYYGKTLLVVFLLGIISLPIWMIFGFALLIFSPFMAAWYASVCFTEIKLLEEKELVHLK
jgi:hypothetical protein